VTPFLFDMWAEASISHDEIARVWICTEMEHDDDRAEREHVIAKRCRCHHAA
jgi:hypothetical protein